MRIDVDRVYINHWLNINAIRLRFIALIIEFYKSFTIALFYIGIINMISRIIKLD